MLARTDDGRREGCLDWGFWPLIVQFLKVVVERSEEFERFGHGGHRGG